MPWPPSGFSHTLSKIFLISKNILFLVVNTGFICIGHPLKIFLPTLLYEYHYFIVFGLTRPGIEPESAISLADALSARRLTIELIQF